MDPKSFRADRKNQPFPAFFYPFLYIFLFLFVSTLSLPSLLGAETPGQSTKQRQSPSIVWETSILQAMERAKKEDKVIFVELYADWCGYCKKLESDILPDPEVVRSLNRFITVRLNGEEYPNFMQRYQARGFPTLLFLDKYANYISKLSGMPTKKIILREADLALKNSDIEKKLLTRIQESPDSLRANFEMGVYYFQTRDFPKSSSFFTKAVGLPAQKGEEDLNRQALYNLALIQMNQGNYTLAVSTWNKYVVKYKKTDSLASAYLHRGIAWRERNNLSRARADLKKAEKLSQAPEELEMIREELKSLSKIKNKANNRR